MMPAYSASDDTLACKIVTFFPSNTKLGMPSHHAQILLYDARYGKLKAVSISLGSCWIQKLNLKSWTVDVTSPSTSKLTSKL